MTRFDERIGLDIIRNGLPPAPAPARVIVAGAGMAGLVAADALKRAGHDVLVLEAQARAGGRVYTMREPFSDGLHAEAGAMRIPRAHRLTRACVERFRLPTIPFTMNNPEAWVRFMGRQVRRREFDADPTSLGLDPADAERPVGEAWEAALAPLFERIGAGGWDAIIDRHDNDSLREFLEGNGWSEVQIELFGLVYHMESLLPAGILELLREEEGRWFTDVETLPEGMDTLPRAFLRELRDNVRFGARVRSLRRTAAGVTVTSTTAAGQRDDRADYAILTLPFPVLRHIEVEPLFSREKQRAIRQLHYDQSTKVFLQSRRRFWEDEGIFGGASVTDLAIRTIYYPEHGRETGRGVLLASYTWGQDAERWAALSPQDRILQAIENVACLHPQVREEFEAGAAHAWHHDEFAGGAFALFEPGQERRLHAAIVAPEGRVHFAGEHASLAHAWIQGAVESGLRAAFEVHQAAAGS